MQNILCRYLELHFKSLRRCTPLNYWNSSKGAYWGSVKCLVWFIYIAQTTGFAWLCLHTHTHANRARTNVIHIKHHRFTVEHGKKVKQLAVQTLFRPGSVFSMPYHHTLAHAVQSRYHSRREWPLEGLIKLYILCNGHLQQWCIM